MVEQTQVQNFFTKKRIFLISLFFLIVIGLISITIIFVIAPDLDLGKLGGSIKGSFNYDPEFAIVLVLLLCFYIFVRAFMNAYPFILRLKQAKIKVKTFDLVIFSFFYSFILMISPSSLLTDPYAVFWLRTKNVSLHKASAITINNDFLSTIVSLILSWPSIIYMGVSGTLGSLLNNGFVGRFIFIFVFVGMAIDVVVLGFLFAFGFSKRIHMFTSLTFNKIRKIFKMNYLTKSQIVEKYMKEAVMRQEFVWMIKDFKGSLIIFLVTLIGFFYMYMCIYLGMRMVNNDITCRISFIHVFSAINVANSANKFIPSPSGQGTMEMCLIQMLKNSNAFTKLNNINDVGGSFTWEYWSQWINDPKNTDPIGQQQYIDNIVNGSTLIWRIFTTYLPGIVGIFFGIFEIKAAVRRQRQRHLFNKPKDKDIVVEFLDNQIKSSREKHKDNPS